MSTCDFLIFLYISVIAELLLFCILLGLSFVTEAYWHLYWPAVFHFPLKPTTNEGVKLFLPVAPRSQGEFRE